MGRDTRGREPRYFQENDVLVLRDQSIALVVCSSEDGQSVQVQPVHEPERKTIDIDDVQVAYAGIGLRGQRFTSTDRERALQLVGEAGAIRDSAQPDRYKQHSAEAEATIHALLDIAEAIRELPDAIVRTWDSEPVTVPVDDGGGNKATGFTAKEVVEIAFQAAGAGTAPLMMDHPDYVFPSERVSAGVRNVLEDFGITPPPGYEASAGGAS